MGEWSAIKHRTWIDRDFEALSPSAALLFLFSFTHEPGASMTGLSVVSERRMMRAARSGSFEHLSEVLEELGEKPFVRYDYEQELLWCVNRAKHVSQSPRWLEGAKRHVAMMPSSPLLDEFRKEYPDLAL